MKYLQSATTSQQRGLEREGNEALSDYRGAISQLINALPMTEVGFEILWCVWRIWHQVHINRDAFLIFIYFFSLFF